MATLFALAHLSALLAAVKPRSAIEFGAGIGTLTYAILAHPCKVATVTTSEDNDFCLGQLERNIPDAFKSRLTVITGMDQLASAPAPVDLVAFDGGFYDPGEVRFLAAGSVCFIEGARASTRRIVEAKLAERGLACDLENHFQGYRYFAFDHWRDRDTNKHNFRFRWRKKIKGCWIGRVSPLDAQAREKVISLRQDQPGAASR